MLNRIEDLSSMKLFHLFSSIVLVKSYILAALRSFARCCTIEIVSYCCLEYCLIYGVPFELEPSREHACCRRCQRFGVELFRCMTDASWVTFRDDDVFFRVGILKAAFLHQLQRLEAFSPMRLAQGSCALRHWRAG